MNLPGISLVFNYTKSNTTAIHTITGALDTASDLECVEMVFAKTTEALISAATKAVARGQRVIVAWSFYSPQFEEAAAELRRIKAALGDIAVEHLVGGVHATAEAESTARAGFDWVAVGEGERTIIEFLRRILKGSDLSTIPGIAFMRDGRFVSNGQGERAQLDDFPPFSARRRKFSPIEITRGCIYACSFCQTPFMFKARFRHRSVANICDHVRDMVAQGATDVRFVTPTSFSYGSQDESVNLPKIEELLAGVRAILGDKGRLFFGTFPSEVRPEHVSPEALRVVKRYVDNDNLIIGGQSGSQAILDSSRRGHTVEQIVAAVAIARDEGFIPNVDFVFGLPGETADDLEASLRLCEDLSAMGARIHAHAFMPLPGTPFKNAAPGIITPETELRLQRLASRGRVYGQWRQQMSVAETLATAARERRES